MKTLVVNDLRQAAAKLAKEYAAPCHGEEILDQDGQAMGPDGSIKALLRCAVIPSELHNFVFELSKNVDGLLANRPSIVGVSSRDVSEIIAPDLAGRAAVFGWDRPGHPTPQTIKHPEILFGNEALGKLSDALFKLHLPMPHAKQLAAIDPHWRLWKTTAFSTFYAIRDHRCTYHTDRNWKGGMTALMPAGDFEGSELVLPGWGLTIRFQSGDLLFFDAGELHGNLPIIKGQRLSIAFYCARQIGKCNK